MPGSLCQEPLTRVGVVLQGYHVLRPLPEPFQEGDHKVTDVLGIAGGKGVLVPFDGSQREAGGYQFCSPAGPTRRTGPSRGQSCPARVRRSTAQIRAAQREQDTTLPEGDQGPAQSDTAQTGGRHGPGQTQPSLSQTWSCQRHTRPRARPARAQPRAPLMSNSYSPFRSQPSYHFCQEVLPTLPRPSSHLSLLKNSLFNVCLPSHLEEAAKGQGLSYHLAAPCLAHACSELDMPRSGPYQTQRRDTPIKPRIWGGTAGSTSLFQEVTPGPALACPTPFSLLRVLPLNFAFPSHHCC